MDTITDEQISPVIRAIDVAKFSELAHGPGRQVAYNVKDKTATIKSPSFMDRFYLNKSNRVYFLKQHTKPLVIDQVNFTWLAGTNNVSLNLTATFQVQVDTKHEDECLDVVKVLYHAEGVGQGMYELIDGAINKVLSRIYTECEKNDTDLLAMFKKNEVLHHESKKLDDEVTTAVRDALGIESFIIGLRLDSLPPQYLDDIETNTNLDIRDVEGKQYHVKTKAEVELCNFQLYKKTGLESKEALREDIKKDIDKTVNKYVWELSFFEIIESFYTSTVAGETKAIATKIEEDICEVVRNKGYTIKLFHTLCNIPPLVLVDRGLRIAITKESHEFRTKEINLPVYLNLTLNARLKSFGKVQSLIKPEYTLEKIREEITKLVFHTCYDVIADAGIYEFDMAFEGSIRTKLTNALNKTLRKRFGFLIEIATLQPVLSENKARLDALINEPQPFNLNISSQADGCKVDNVRYQGAFIVTEMAPNGYSRFVSRDYGYCHSSMKRRDSAYQILIDLIRTQTGRMLSLDSDSFEQEWQRYCIELELQSIADGIQTNAEEYFSKEKQVAAKTRNFTASKQLREYTEKIGQLFATKEFGLVIEITRFKRLDTDTEAENEERRVHDRELRSQYLKNDSDVLTQKLGSDAKYQEALANLELDVLKTSYADGDLTRADIQDEMAEQPSTTRDDLFKELDEETIGVDAIELDSDSLLAPGRSTSLLGGPTKANKTAFGQSSKKGDDKGGSKNCPNEKAIKGERESATEAEIIDHEPSD